MFRTPARRPSQLPQFDSEPPNLLLLPIEFPDYNDIDSIDSENVLRFGLRNTLQTKRDGAARKSSGLELMLDWRLKSRTPSAADLQRPLFRPRVQARAPGSRSNRKLRYDINNGNLNLALHQLTFSPNERWSWGIGHWYLRDGFWRGQRRRFCHQHDLFTAWTKTGGCRADALFQRARTDDCRSSFTASTATCEAGPPRSPSA